MNNQLITLAHYLAGEFDNQPQALAEPAWYVHLRLWLRPVPLFREDSLTLFAEQASVVNLDRPYRPRLLRLQAKAQTMTIQYYKFKEIEKIQGAARQPQLLQSLNSEAVEALTEPGCTLKVQMESLGGEQYRFRAFSATDIPCYFSYGGQSYAIALGLSVSADELQTYDKGIDLNTGKGVWGALMGPYCFKKRQDFSGEFFGY